MGCLTAVLRVFGCLGAVARRLCGLTARAWLWESKPCLCASAGRKDALMAQGSLVCSIGNAYLRVSPKETRWITDGEILTYDIESNVNWIVKL